MAIGAICAAALLGAARPAHAQFTRASVAHDGNQPDENSSGGRPSADGRFVAFTSNATNLVPGDTNGVADIFVRDLLNNTIERVSVTSGGVQADRPSVAQPSISDDGHLVFFVTAAALVPEDTRACGVPAVAPVCLDVYVHDRDAHTTTLLSRAPGNTEADNGSDELAISADGRYVAFTSLASNLVPNDTNGVADVFLLDRTTGAITRVSTGENGEQSEAASSQPAISADGTVVGFETSHVFSNYPGCVRTTCHFAAFKTVSTGALALRVRQVVNGGIAAIALNATGTIAAVRWQTAEQMGSSVIHANTLVRYDLAAPAERTVDVGSIPAIAPAMDFGAALSRDGRYIAFGRGFSAMSVYDDVTGATTDLMNGNLGHEAAFSANGRYLTFSTLDTLLVPGDTNGKMDVFRYDQDSDGDGMSTVWETTYGFDPSSPADAGTDADGDGVTNLQEFLAGTHPKGTHTRYFAEGASNSFFLTKFAFLNPTASPANVVLRLLGDNGTQRAIPIAIGARTHAMLHDIAGKVPSAAYSAIVESDQAVIIDRATSWSGSTGLSLETSIAAPETSWFFAEGATGNGFSLYYLLNNPGDTDASVTVDYLRPAPLPVLSETITVAAHSRLTLDVAARFPDLLSAEISGRLTSTRPIVAERAMYRSTPGKPFDAGHAGAGIVTPAPRWFLAEGATGFFDEYVLVANPTNTDTSVTFTFLPQGGAAFDVTRPVKANSRYTLDVKEFAALANTSVSIVAASVDSTPIVVERAMWWPSGQWYEASLSAGVTATGTLWGIAAGEQDSSKNTYVLVANTDPTRDGEARITLVFQDGTSINTTIGVLRNSRNTLDVGTLIPDGSRGTFGIIVEGLDSLPIVVERSLYYTPFGTPLFSGGGTSVATNITPPS